MVFILTKDRAFEMKKVLGCILFWVQGYCWALPQGFVYLHQVDPDIIEDMRYATSYNFTGRPVPGYLAPKCILSKPAARQLKKVQKAANKIGYRLKVFDCYRPQKAVKAFVGWSQRVKDNQMKPWFYPDEEKSTLFSKGYIAEYSGHTRGSTLDLTLVKSGDYPSNCNYKTCPPSIDMGTPFDYFDHKAHVFAKGLTQTQKQNRMLLRRLMKQYGFRPYSKEWWHFTLNNEPYKRQYFDFNVA